MPPFMGDNGHSIHNTPRIVTTHHKLDPRAPKALFVWDSNPASRLWKQEAQTKTQLSDIAFGLGKPLNNEKPKHSKRLASVAFCAICGACHRK
jgi:hypothetical protein